MAISYIYTGQPMTGTADDDFIIAYKGSTSNDNNTVNAGAGDDLVIGDSTDTWIPGQSYLNGSIGAAFNLETLTSTWTTSENEMFGDWTIPHTTIIGETTIGQSEFFRVQIGAGQQITIDLDFASATGIGNTADLVVEILDSLGNVLVTADDSLLTQGGRGSFPISPGGSSSYDPFLTFNAPSTGVYYINLRPFGGGPGATFTENNTFVMNISVTGHAVAASNAIQGNDIINGGDGNDALLGHGGDDVINGDGGDDLIDSGSGADIAHGGDGNDTLYGGDGSEENIHGDKGNDTLISGGEGHYYGDAGNDIIFAGLTAGVSEVLDGGADVDTIDTTSWNGSYEINLAAGSTNFGESFINFENIVSGNGADFITGTAGANIITTQGGTDDIKAGAGDDVVEGGADGDSLDGGADFDILSYRRSSGAVTINLIVNTVSGGHAAGDLISNFEGVWGSVLGDTLTADIGNNELRGFEGNDTLSGGVGNDILDGGINDDVMTGGGGDDTYSVDSQGDSVTELNGEGTDTIESSVSLGLAGLYVENLTLTDSGNINATGNSLANTLTGNAGNNLLDGGGNADTMRGGAGNDRYIVDNAGDTVTELKNEGTDTVESSLSFSLAGQYIEKLTLTGSGSNNATGNSLANTLTGNSGNNVLAGLDGNDTLIGGAGADTMVGGTGDDRYIVDNASDTVSELNGEGTDTIESSVTFSLAGQYVEVLKLTGSGNINATGNSLANTLVGNAGANVLTGLGGNDTLIGGTGVDTLIGGLGNDRYVVNSAGDTVTELNGEGTDTVESSVSFSLAGQYVEKLTLTGSGNTNATGNSLANSLTGNTGANVLTGLGGNDTLIGGTGADTLIGGTGNDRYIVDNAGDTVTELNGEGTDTVESSVSFSLAGQYVENLTLTGSGNNDATGNSLANTLIGNAGVNVLTGLDGNDALIGGTGADTMRGGAGNDRYIVDNAGDTVTELSGEGADTVESSISFSLAGLYVENLTLTGSGNTNASGNSLANTLVGNAGTNVLNGGTNADTMRGGAGDDRYIVDNAGDTVTELSGEGADTVESSVSFSLAGQYVENLTLTGSGNTNATGNSLINTLVGNAGNNVLNGGANADTMRGGLGDDRYIVDNAGDTVTELGGAGTDTVDSSISFSLVGLYVENLTLTGSGNINATGNSLVNTLVGNAGNNVLNGGTNADTMRGGAGDDRYIVDNAGDTVTELGSEGTDTVESSVSFSLAGQYVEVLKLTGSGNINATGNGQINTLVGNAGNNVLDGGGKADTLTGGGGADSFQFSSALGASNIDAITDYSVPNDRIVLNDAVFTGLAAGVLTAAAFRTGAAAADASDRIIYNSATGALLFDADGAGGAAAVQFATLTAGLAMTNTEFLVI